MFAVEISIHCEKKDVQAPPPVDGGGGGDGMKMMAEDLDEMRWGGLCWARPWS